MNKLFFVENGICKKKIFRAWKWSKDKLKKITPRPGVKSLYFTVNVDCSYCGCC